MVRKMQKHKKMRTNIQAKYLEEKEVCNQHRHHFIIWTF